MCYLLFYLTSAFNVYSIEKEFVQRSQSFVSQRDKLDETYKRETERLLLKRTDLVDQLLKMQDDKKVRMDAFIEKKMQLESQLMDCRSAID